MLPARQTASRAGVAATLLLIASAGAVHDATATNDTRTLSFHHTHSGEDLTITFKREGRYDEDALKKLNFFLRDWRTQDQTVMDRHLFDILWEVYQDVGANKPIQIISSYRSPATNAMLRRRSAHTGVARFSQHMLGHAMDFFIPGVPLEQIRFAGLRLQRGGVGFYPTSGSPFVHLDTGNVRHWPRMTHDQLARVFPDGKTVHIPSDGVPLAGYQLAMAEIHNRKGDDSTSTMSRPGLFASLFKGKQSDDEDEAGATADPAATPSLVTASNERVKDQLAFVVPLPRPKPVRTATYQVASIAQAVQVASVAQTIAAKPAVLSKSDPRTESKAESRTPAEIVTARFAWDDSAATPRQATPEQIAAVKARNAANAEITTASLPGTIANAMAYAPALDRSKIVTASAPLPTPHLPSFASTAIGASMSTMVGKALHGQTSPMTTIARVAHAVETNSIWLRAIMLTRNANTSLSASLSGDQDMTLMSGYFIKPARMVTMTFCDDPQMGLSTDHFSGQALSALGTTNFQTASLQ